MNFRDEARRCPPREHPWRRGLVALLVVLSTTANSGAEGTTAKSQVPSVTFVHLPDGARALPELGAEVARLPISEPSFVAVTSIAVPKDLKSVIGTKALETLRQEIRRNVAATVPLAKIHAKEALSPRDARTRARQASLPLVLLSPAIKSGELFLDVTVTKWPLKFWRRALAPEGVRTEALRVRVGAESLRHLFPVAKDVVTGSSIVKSPLSAPVAIACGDIDGDGQRDLAVVGRHLIVLGELYPDSFKEKARQTWQDLSAVHGAPLRAPLAAARIERGLLTVGLSDRTHTVHLGSALQVVGKSPRGYPLPGGRCLSFFPAGGLGREFDCQLPLKSVTAPPAPSPRAGEQLLDAYSNSTHQPKTGIFGSVTTSLTLGSSVAAIELALPSEQLVQLTLPGTGSALVSGDLDGNGTVEIISSSDSPPDSKDRLRVHTVRAGKLEKLAEIETSAIAALALCPFDGENPLTLVMATAEELWILK